MPRLPIAALCLCLVTVPSRAASDETPGDRPKGPPATEVLAAAQAAAKADGKLVFLAFGSPTCGWCKYLDKFHARPAVARVLTPHLVFAKVDVVDNPGADKLYEKYFPEPGGVPTWVVLGPDGEVRADSVEPGKGNVGFPAEPNEVAYYEAVLRRVLPKLAGTEITLLVAELKDAAPKPDPAAVRLREALDALQGVWNRKADADGKPGPSFWGLGGDRLIVTGRSFAGGLYAGSVRLDPDAGHADFHVDQGMYDGAVLPGRYELKGGLLTLALPSDPYGRSGRPSDLTPGARRRVIVYERDAGATAEDAQTQRSAAVQAIERRMTPELRVRTLDRKTEMRFEQILDRLERIEKRLEETEKKK